MNILPCQAKISWAVAMETGTSTGEIIERDALVQRHIERVLAQTAGKIDGAGSAGALLGVDPNPLRYKMKQLGIPFGKRTRGAALAGGDSSRPWGVPTERQ